MSYKYIKLTALFLLLSATTRAQDTLATSITYDLTAETAVGTGDFTAFQLATNRHHVLSTRANTAYLRGAINISHAFNKNLTLSGGLDAIASVHANHKAYLQQCFVNLTWKSFFVEIGSREQICCRRVRLSKEPTPSQFLRFMLVRMASGTFLISRVGYR